jgi:hypothetical protein
MITALCSAVLFGCSDKSAVPPHLIAVPKDAVTVLSLNAKQIVEKAELNKPEQYQFYSLLQQELQNSAHKDVVKDFLKNTRSSGLNLDNIFVYMMESGDIECNMSFGAVFLIDKLKTFEKFLEKSGLYPDTENRLVRLFEGITIQWNDKIAVLSRNVVESGVDIFNADESQSILANELFKEEYSGKNDVWLFFEYNVIGELLKEYPYAKYATAPEELSAMFDLYKDLSMSMSLNAEKGELVATGKILPAEKATELFGKFYKTDFDRNLYHYFHDKSLLAFKFALKPLDIYNEYKKYFSGLAGDRDVEIFMERYDAKVISVLSNFTGDCLGSLMSFSATPDFAIAAGVVEGKENEVIKLMEGLGFVKRPEGYYSLGGGVNLYFAVNNSAAYLTGSVAHITDFLANTHYTANIATAKDFGRELEEALCYFYWDVNINNYPSILKSVLSMSEQGNMAMPLLEKLKSISTGTVGTNGSEFKVIFNDNEYASKTLLKAADDLISQYFN